MTDINEESIYKEGSWDISIPKVVKLINIIGKDLEGLTLENISSGENSEKHSYLISLEDMLRNRIFTGIDVLDIFEELEEEYNKFRGKYKELEGKYNNSDRENEELREQRDSLLKVKKQLDSLKEEYNKLGKENEEISGTIEGYHKLIKEVEELRLYKPKIERIKRIVSGLTGAIVDDIHKEIDN